MLTSLLRQITSPDRNPQMCASNSLLHWHHKMEAMEISGACGVAERKLATVSVFWVHVCVVSGGGKARGRRAERRERQAESRSSWEHACPARTPWGPMRRSPGPVASTAASLGAPEEEERDFLLLDEYFYLFPVTKVILPKWCVLLRVYHLEARGVGPLLVMFMLIAWLRWCIGILQRSRANRIHV